MEDTELKVLIAVVGLIVKGYIKQVNKGVWPSDKGFKRAEEVWLTLTDEDKLLLIPYLRVQLGLVGPEGERDEGI